MTIEQVAEYLQIEPEDVRRLIDTRGLRAFEVADGELRVPFDELRRWMRQSLAERFERPAGVRQDQGGSTIADGVPRLTQEFFDRIKDTREAILAERGGKPFPRGWIREAIDEGRM